MSCWCGSLCASLFTGQMELFLKGQDAINDDLPGEDPEVVAEAIDGEAGPLNGMYYLAQTMLFFLLKWRRDCVGASPR